MNADLSNLFRLLQNLIRLGTIAEVEDAKARVQLGPKLTTEWLNWITQRAGSTCTWSAPTVGEQVMVLSPGGDLARGIILPALFSKAFDAPETSDTIHTTHYPDGAVVQYDHAAHALTATLPGGTATITADRVTSDAPTTICTGDVTIMGNLIVKQSATVDGTTALNGGVNAKAGAAGGPAVAVQGTVKASDDVLAGAISLARHWHLLMFVRPTAKYKTVHLRDVAGRAIRIMKRYAWRADRGEPGAFKRRLDVKRIDWAKGSAAGYIAKYVAKNIDGVAEHKTKEGYVVTPEMDGDIELTPSARVESWAACWGIRQFQQWGGAPVTVWRELRRIEESMVNEAPPAMRQAWNAVQKIDGEKRACWAEYLRAQGGALVPRKELAITLAKDEKTVIGRYGETERITPYGVRCSALIGVVYKSVRHTWTPVKATGVSGVAVGVAVPRTRVNNCARPVQLAPAAPLTVPPATPEFNLSDQDKAAVIEAWAAVGACPYPRLVIPDTSPHTGGGT